MLIGVPKEIKNQEYRVGLTPESVLELCSKGHKVLVEKNAGIGIGATDTDYRKVGANIAKNANEVFKRADMVVKVKEPLTPERKKLRRGQILFTYLHLAANAPMTHELMKCGAVCIAYEMVTSEQGALPLLSPMSQVAGRLSAQAAAACLQRHNGGNGKLISGLPGVAPAKILILGGGVVGRNSAEMFLGLGGDVTILDRSLDVMKQLDIDFRGSGLKTMLSNKSTISTLIPQADVLIGGVLIPGSTAPKIITSNHVKSMKPGSVIVDVAIDQGGCVATAKATTHSEPTYIKHDIVHYCVANMPGAVPKTSTYALNAATLPYITRIADVGWKVALSEDKHLLNALSVSEGQLTCSEAGRSLKIKYVPKSLALN